MKTKKIFSILFLAGLITVLILPVTTLASEFKAGQTFSLYKDETVSGNLYTAGRNITIDGKVDGDLLTAGGNILINGAVRDDLIAAGGTINVIGQIGQDLRLAGGNIIVSSSVNGDLVAAGGTIELTSNSAVKGDVMIAGGAVVINGPVEGNITIKGGEVTINSEVKGKISVTASSKLTLGSRANIKSDLNYTSPKEAAIDSNAKIEGKLAYNPMPAKAGKKGARGLLAVFTFLWLMKLVALVVTALIIFHFFRKETIQIADKSLQNFAKYLLRGFIFLFLVPIAIIILFITLFGIVLALLVLFAYLAILILSGIYSGVVFGGVLYKLLQRDLGAIVAWENIIVGVVVLMLVGIIPFIGWLIAFIFFLVALGSVTELIFERLSPQ